MYYVLIGYEDERWRAEGLDDFDCRMDGEGSEGLDLDALKRRVFHAVQEANNGNTIIVKWVYTNTAYSRHRRLLNEHMKKPEDAGAKLLAEAIGEDDNPD